LYKCVLGGTADIQYLASGSNLSNNTINGDVKGDSNAFSLITLTDSTIEYGGEIKDNAAVAVEKSRIGGLIDGNTAAILSSVKMDYGSMVRDNTLVRVFNSRLLHNADIASSDHQTYYYNDSVIDTTKTGITLSAVTVVRDDITPFRASDGETMRLYAPVYEDLLPTTSNANAGGAAPTMTLMGGSSTIRAQHFANASPTEEYQAVWQLPHGWKEATEVEPHVHLYVPDDATGGNIVLSMVYTWQNKDNGTMTETTVTSTPIVRAANAGINGNCVATFGTIAGTGKTISSLFSARIMRVQAGADTFGGSIWLRSVDMHIQVDTLGSRTISAK